MNTFSNLLSLATPENNSFEIFGFEIYYYAICIVVGIAVAACLATLLMHRRNISTDVILLCFIVCVPSAIIGARLYACLSDSSIGIQNFFHFRDGGLSIMGGIFGGAISALVLCLIKKWNFFRITDCIAPVFPLAQAIGRWGNYFNQEVYGGVVANESLQFFPISVFIERDGQWHYAFFFYESVVNFLWFILLFILAWKLVKKPNGLLTAMFFGFYGIVRAIMEPLRDSSFRYGNGEGIDSSLIASYVLILAGVGLIVFLLLWNKKKEGKLFGSLNGDPYVVTEFIPSTKGEEPRYTKINYATYLQRCGEKKTDGDKQR